MKQKRILLASPRKTNMALLAAAVLLPFLTWNYLLSPALNGLSDAEGARASADQMLAAAAAEAETLNLAEEQKTELETKLASLQAQLPSKLDTSNLLAEIQATAMPATVASISFGVPVLPPEPELAAIPGLHQVPVTVRLEGDALLLLGYPERLTQLSALLVVDTTAFAPPEGGWGGETANGSIDISARAWVVLEAPPAATDPNATPTTDPTATGTLPTE